MLLVNLHHRFNSLQRTHLLHRVRNLPAVRTDTARDDMQVVVARVMMEVHQYRLPLIIVAHSVQILPCNLDQLILGILVTLTRDSRMKLRHPSAVITCRIVHEVVPQGRNPTHFRCILQIPEVADDGQFRHPMLHLPLIVADSRKGAA